MDDEATFAAEKILELNQKSVLRFFYVTGLDFDHLFTQISIDDKDDIGTMTGKAWIREVNRLMAAETSRPLSAKQLGQFYHALVTYKIGIFKGHREYELYIQEGETREAELVAREQGAQRPRPAEGGGLRGGGGNRGGNMMVAGAHMNSRGQGLHFQ